MVERTLPSWSSSHQCWSGNSTTGRAGPRFRLALIIVFDQFSPSIHRGTARAFAHGHEALDLTLQGIEIGHCAVLETPCEKTFFLGRSEEFAHLETAVRLAAELVEQGPSEIGRALEPSASQAIGTSSPASAATLIATPSWAGINPRIAHLPGWMAGNSCIRGHCCTDPELAGPFESASLVTCCARTIRRWRACSSRSRPG
jgi:hypothetical protein